MNPLAVPLIPIDPDFDIGHYPIDRTLRELDGLAESWGWMPEPRHMNAFRKSPFYNQPLRTFFREHTPASFCFSNRIIRAHAFILWRILDWGCGMDPLARQWLESHAGGSMTYALRTGSPADLNRVYETHMRGPGVHYVRVAPPMMTAYVDYAERLFGYHPVAELAPLIPFLCNKAISETERPHDPVYFLSRAIAFLLERGESGQALLAPHQQAIAELAEEFDKRPHEGPGTEPSEYSDMTLLEEARTGMQQIQRALTTRDAGDAMYLDTIWTTEFLDETYHRCFGLALRHNTPETLASAGLSEQGMLLTQHVVTTSIRRWGPGHRHTFAALECQAHFCFRQKRWNESIAVQRDILDRHCQLQGANDPLTLQAAMRLGETYLQAGQTAAAIPLFKDTLMKSRTVFEPDHFIIKFCADRLHEYPN
jgi:hypothetical protein